MKPARTCIAVLLAASLPGALSAQSGGTFTIQRSSIDAGGGTSIGAAYTLRGTVGQPDAYYSEGGGYALRGGFWGAATPVQSDTIFSDGFE